MLLIYAVVIGLLAGLVAGGRVDRLGDVRIAWAWPALAGLLVQVALFADPVTSAVGPALPYLYVGSTALVFVALLRNVRLPGVPLVALGAASNLAAILANGGYMPVSPDALAAIGRGGATGIHANTVVAGPGSPLALLGDVIPVPPPIPGANAVSIGDILIAAGAVVFLVLVMRGRGVGHGAPEPSRTRAGSPEAPRRAGFAPSELTPRPATGTGGRIPDASPGPSAHG